MSISIKKDDSILDELVKKFKSLNFSQKSKFIKEVITSDLEKEADLSIFQDIWKANEKIPSYELENDIKEAVSCVRENSDDQSGN